MSPLLDSFGSSKGFGWSLVASAPPAFDSISSANGTGSSTTITFSSIPQTYESLQIRGIANVSSGPAQITLNINGGSYTMARHELRGDEGSVSVGNNINANPVVGNAAATSSHTAPFIIDIYDYSSTTRNKVVKSFYGRSSAGFGVVSNSSGLFATTAAITSIALTSSSGNFTSTSQFSLYGIKGVS